MACTVEEERPLAVRLESLEDMVKDVVGKLARMESKQARVERSTAAGPQPTFSAVQDGNNGHPQDYAAAAVRGVTLAPAQVKQLLGAVQRQRRNSLKRSVGGTTRDTEGNAVGEDDSVFTDVV